MKKLLIAATLLVSSSAAMAGIGYLPGGVTWNKADVNSTPNGGNFFTNINFRQWFVDGSGTTKSLFDLVNDGDTVATLTGLGKLEQGTGTGRPLPGSYELTFEFGGINVNPATGLVDATANPGFLNIYLDTDLSDLNGGYDSLAAVSSDVLNATIAADATDGILFLGLDFVTNAYNPEFDPNSIGINDPATADQIGIWGNDMFNGLIGGDADFGFQVSSTTPGLAGANFDTDFATVAATIVDAIGFGLTSNFQVQYTKDGAGDYTGITGINTYSQNSTGTVEAIAVSAPSSVAFLGLGILGLGLFARRRK